MIFPSATFLFAFLPVVLAASWMVPKRWQNHLLLVASLCFYAWGAGGYVALLVWSTLVDFVLGRAAARARVAGRTRAVSGAVTLSVIANLGMLAWFKYAGFAARSLNALIGDPNLPIPEVLLPIGISFFTFQSMSYTIDISRGDAEPVDRLVDFGLFVTMFPQLIAGPIVRYREIAPQLRTRERTVERFAAGSVRFSHGLVKKVLIADGVAAIADQAFARADTVGLPALMMWIGLLAFSMQIYFDFSGYSDMAIGLGLMFGFDLPENFRRPYSATSVTDFWRRWHITLSAWFRDYLYVPLGGNRRGRRRTLANLLVVFALTGLWHGAATTFVAWGLLHGAALVIERVRSTPTRSEVTGMASAWPRARTFLFVTFAWGLFRADSVSAFGGVVESLFGRHGVGNPFALVDAFAHRDLAVLAVASLVVLLPPSRVVGPWLATASGRKADTGRALTFVSMVPTILIVSAGAASPFLYFAF